MQGNKILKADYKQSGFSLIELMIAIAIGLLITAAVTAMAVNSLKMNSDTLKSARLNQDLGAVMQIMVNDIRRAGYTGDAPAFDTDEDVYIESSDCILYSYNRGATITSIDGNERNGFKLDGGIIKMRTSCTGTDCSTDCSPDTGTWVELTDPDVISIKSLTFTTANSKCTSIDAEMSIRIKPDVADTEFACGKATVDNVQKGAIDGDGNWNWVDLTDATGLPLSSATPPIIGLRHVNISLEAELANDSSVSKKLDVSVRIRNDYVVPKS